MEIYREALADFLGTSGGGSTVKEEDLGLEISLDGEPRELRVVQGSERWQSIVLWEDVNLELFFEGLALEEAHRIRWGEVASPDSYAEVDEIDESAGEELSSEGQPIDLIPVFGGGDELEDWADRINNPEGYEYVPLPQVRPNLSEDLIARYVPLFLRFGRFSSSRSRDAAETLLIEIAPEADPPMIRCTSTFTGETRWLYGWNGSDGSCSAGLNGWHMSTGTGSTEIERSRVQRTGTNSFSILLSGSSVPPGDSRVDNHLGDGSIQYVAVGLISTR